MPRAEIQEVLRLRFEASEFELGSEVAPARLLEALRTLRDNHGYRFYVCASATDRPEHFEVVHGLRNADTFDDFWVKVKLPKPLREDRGSSEETDADPPPTTKGDERAAYTPELDSAALVYAGADWHEREILDLFGISFRGHPNPLRILMPDDYEGHPLRKDFAIDTPWGYRPGPAPEENE